MRCFIAVDVTDKLKPKIIELQKHLAEYDVKIVESENLHFTLKFLGEIDNHHEITNKLEFLRNIKSFEISLVGVGVFPSEKFIRVVWIGAESGGLINLQKSVENALSKDKEKFLPHLTIARVRTQEHAKEIMNFIEKNANIEIGAMKVVCVKLKKSILTEKGPVYSDIETFELVK